MSKYYAKPRWTRKQINFLSEQCDLMTDDEIAVALGRSVKSVRHKRVRLGIGKEHGRSVCKVIQRRPV